MSQSPFDNRPMPRAGKQPRLYVPDTPPAPNPFTEERVNGELAALDDHFFIKWMPTAYWNERFQRFEGRYALMQRWTENDPRMAWVREGKYDPKEAADLWCWFCENIHNANSVPQSPESMIRLMMEYIQRSDNTRFPWRQRVAEVAAHNLKRQQSLKDEIVEQAVEEAKDSYYHSNRATRIFT